MNEAYWFVSRATGVVATALLTASFMLGLLTANRDRVHGAGLTVITALHRSLSLGTVVFLAAHVVTAIVDGFVDLSWVDVVVPFAAGYERAWTGLGTIAVDLLLAVVATSLLRHRLPETAWRWLHLTAYLLWPFAIVHGYLLGTSDQPLLRGITLACAAVGVGAAAWRVVASTADERRRTAIASQEWS